MIKTKRHKSIIETFITDTVSMASMAADCFNGIILHWPTEEVVDFFGDFLLLNFPAYHVPTTILSVYVSGATSCVSPVTAVSRCSLIIGPRESLIPIGQRIPTSCCLVSISTDCSTPAIHSLTSFSSQLRLSKVSVWGNNFTFKLINILLNLSY